MDNETYEDKISELELKYENLESIAWIVFSVLVAVLAHQEWSNWIVTISLAAGVYFVGWKYIAERPFTKGSKSE